MEKDELLYWLNQTYSLAEKKHRIRNEKKQINRNGVVF